METNKQKQSFNLEDIGGKHVAGAYFNMALENLANTVRYMFTHAGVELELLNALDYNSETMFKILGWFYTINFANDESKQKQWSYIEGALEKGIKEKDYYQKIAKINIMKQKLYLTNATQVKLQLLMFKHIPAMGPIMDAVSQYNHNSQKQKSNVVKESDLACIIKGISFNNCLYTLKILASALTNLRHFYTHKNPYNDPKSWNWQQKELQTLSRYMEKVFTASRRLDKERNMITTQEMEFLTSCKDLPNARYRRVLTDEKDRNGRSIFKMVEREDFFYKISTGTGDNKTLSDFGKLLFGCLFLTRHYARLFVNEEMLFNNSPYSPNQNMIIREMLTIYHINLPKEKRIDPQSTKGALALDMLNEISKCPKELYEVLSAEGKAFFEKKNEDSEDEDTVKMIRYSDRFPNLAMRYIDETEMFKDIRFQVQLGKYRFNFYDRQCIDGTQQVRSWQKEINGFGRLQEVEAIRKKKWENQLQQRESIVVEQEYGNIELEQLPVDTADSQPYVTDMRASYRIEANHIGMSWNLKDGTFVPTLKVKKDETGNNKADVQQLAPMCTMSMYDIPAMLFYQYLYQRSECMDLPSAEDIIKHKYEAIKAFYNAVSEGASKSDLNALMKEKGLSKTDLTDKLMKYLENDNLPMKFFKKAEKEKLIRHAIQLLSNIVTDAERRIESFKDKKKKIGTSDNKYGKKGYADIRHGKLAQYLAQSLLMWQPSQAEGKDKLTGLDYSQLQAFLATYGQQTDIEMLNTVLKNAKLINSTIPHPFIKGVLAKQPRHIEELYQYYIESELKYASYLKQELEENRDIDKHLQEIAFSGAQAERWKMTETVDGYYQNYAKRCLIAGGQNSTVVLPDGLFTEWIVKLLKSDYRKNQQFMKLLSENKTKNATYLIQLYYKYALEDGCQPFYDANNKKFNRAYRPFSVLADQHKGNELLPRFMNANEIADQLKANLENEIANYVKQSRKLKTPKEKEEMKQVLKKQIAEVSKTEKTIRRYRTEDMVLYMVAKDLFVKLISEDINYNDLQVRERAEKKAKTLKLKNMGADTNEYTGIRFDYKYRTNDGNELLISQEGLSLKNYGNIYRVLADERMETLAQGLLEKGIKETTFAEITSEFANYDKERSKVFKVAHEIEQEAFDTGLLDNESRNHFKDMIKVLPYGRDDKYMIRSIRNAFGHNSYQNIDFIKLEMTNEEECKLPNVARNMRKAMRSKR